MVVFGSVLAMGLPIMNALFGLGVGLAAITLCRNLMSVPEFSTQLAEMIGIGVGIDYALFIVARYRQGIHADLDPHSAVVKAIVDVRQGGLLRRLHGDHLARRHVPHRHRVRERARRPERSSRWR